MIVKGEPDEAVTKENFTAVREYILNAIEKGRMNFSGWPLENFQAIAETPDPEGKATELLNVWVERHMLRKTRSMMFSDLREAQFEAAKRAAEVILSQETRNALREYRDRSFGEGQGSMELAVKQLLEQSRRALPQDAVQLLEAFRQRKGLKTLGDAIRALIDLAERHPPLVGEQPPARTEKPDTVERTLHQEVKKLLREMKGQIVLTDPH
ncbi:MAG: hypothetical protein HQM02_09365 [Magnetococcales bacterium]|nr:hypothetical protein [Magnetococcales bacterium]